MCSLWTAMFSPDFPRCQSDHMSGKDCQRDSVTRKVWPFTIPSVALKTMDRDLVLQFFDPPLKSNYFSKWRPV